MNVVEVDFNFIDYREHLTGQYKAVSQNVFAELGYRLDTGDLRAEPFAGIGFARYHRQGFQEKGGYSALNVGAQTQQNLSSTLGLRVAKNFTLDNQMTLKPNLSASWKHLYGDVSSRVRQSFVAISRPLAACMSQHALLVHVRGSRTCSRAVQLTACVAFCVTVSKSSV